MRVTITANFELSEFDYELAKNSINDFLAVYQNSGITNFYTTLFYEDSNRKLRLNFAFGRCTKCVIEKIHGDE